ncbi:hypothetical protein C8R43DRAFT_1027514 [Mycena crocata]|nr:hypothetical protein C8R43DRAFT_1027514 [Mycena crocata]
MLAPLSLIIVPAHRLSSLFLPLVRHCTGFTQALIPLALYAIPGALSSRIVLTPFLAYFLFLFSFSHPARHSSIFNPNATFHVGRHAEQGTEALRHTGPGSSICTTYRV